MAEPTTELLYETDAYLRVEIGSGDTRLGERRVDSGRGRGQIVVGDENLVDQRVEIGIAELRPPAR